MQGRLSPAVVVCGAIQPVGVIRGELISEAVLSGAVTGTGEVRGSITGTGCLAGTLTVPVALDVDIYDGAYEFTPSRETQTVRMQYKTALSDITINPIPQNYGLITWDGTTITVS